MSSSVSIDSEYELWPVEIALFALLLWQMAQWLHHQISISDMHRMFKALNVLPPNSLSALVNTLRSTVCTPWYLDTAVDFHSGTPTTITVSSPEIIKDVVQTQSEVFNRGPFFRGILYDMLGDGIFSADGASQTASDLFISYALQDAMTTSVHKRVPVLFNVLQRDMEAGQLIDLTKLLNKFTTEVLAEIGLCVDLGCLDSAEDHPFQKAFDSAQAILFLRFIRPAWLWKTMRWLNIGREKELKTCLQYMNDLVLDSISEALEHRAATQKQQTPPEETEARGAGETIVSLFLDDEGEDIDPSNLRDIVISVLLAGRDSTTQTMSWFFYMLSQYPEAEREIRDEIAIKIPELLSGETTAPAMDQVSQLYYLEAALIETLRLYPSEPATFRQANPDTWLCDGAFVTFCTGRPEQIRGVDAKVFNPTRWIEPESGRLKSSAFGAGSRLLHFAMNEMKVVAASMLARFHLKLVSGQRMTFELSPLFVRVEPV